MNALQYNCEERERKKLGGGIIWSEKKKKKALKNKERGVRAHLFL